MTLTITELEPLGAVIGADIDTLLDDPDVPVRLMQALEDNGVLIFPEVNMTDAQQVAVADQADGHLIDHGDVGDDRAHGDDSLAFGVDQRGRRHAVARQA